MKTANEIAEQIKLKYSDFVRDCFVQNEKRIWLELDLKNFRNCIEKFISDEDFPIFCTMTGLDLTDKFQVIYHFSNKNGVMLNIKVSTERQNPSVISITDLFPAAELAERELEDLLGIKVQGLVAGRRYPLPDKWPQGQYPLRKDWNPDSLNKTTEKVQDGGEK